MENNENNNGGIGPVISAILPLKIKLGIIIGIVVFFFVILIPVLFITVISTDTYQNQNNEQTSSGTNNSDGSESGSVVGTGEVKVISKNGLYYPTIGGKVYYAFCYPVTDFSRISASFGAGGSNWKNKHTGTDFIGKSGCSVVSVADGIVYYSGKNSAYGNYVIVQHIYMQNKELLIFYTQYCHMENSSITVSKGDKVVQGQVLGKQGATGNVTGPHVHFEFANHQPSSNNQLYSYTKDPISNLYAGAVFNNYPAIKQKYWSQNSVSKN